METLKEAILRLAPKVDLLHECLGYGRFADVMIASDGCFYGHVWGEIGFNYFLGAPSPSAIVRAQALFAKLSDRHQNELLRALYARRIPPEALGLPSGNHVN